MGSQYFIDLRKECIRYKTYSHDCSRLIVPYINSPKLHDHPLASHYGKVVAAYKSTFITCGGRKDYALADYTKKCHKYDPAAGWIEIASLNEYRCGVGAVV